MNNECLRSQSGKPIKAGVLLVPNDVFSYFHSFNLKMVSNNKINVLMVGTGEYTTGYVNGASSTSDKKVCKLIRDIGRKHC